VDDGIEQCLTQGAFRHRKALYVLGALVGRCGRVPLRASERSEFRLIAHFACDPDGHEIEMAYEGDVSQELLRSYFDALITAAKPFRTGRRGIVSAGDVGQSSSW